MLPYLEYGIEIWHSAYKNVTDKLFILQKKAIRYTFNLEYNSHTTQYFKDFGVLELADIHKFKILTILYSCLNYETYPFIYDKLNLGSLIHSHHTRTANSLRLPLYNRSKSQKSFLYASIKSWNSLPDTSFNSVRSFKVYLLNRLLNQY